MAVYVDAARLPLGRMLMSHMVADTTAELLEMADRIGVDRRHLQHPGTHREHFDICQSKRRLAVKAGATEVSQRELGKILRAKRLR